MRIATLVASLFALSLVLAACGHEEEPFDTLQACYDDHHSGSEQLTVQQAIVVCCLDHPIAGVHPSCKNTQAECVTHVRAQLNSAVVDTDIGAACTTYISMK